MERGLKQRLVAFSKATISEGELADLFPEMLTYEAFADHVLSLETAGILRMIKSAGRNGRHPDLANRYRINKFKIQEEHHQTLQHYRFIFHIEIDLDSYFVESEAVWLADLPYLKKINQYILEKGFPEVAAAAPERSFELVGDEKWIVEKKGETLLRRVGIWDMMKIFPVSDPLMLAINPHLIRNQRQFHLVVENKTTYDALLRVLTQSQFSTLIYGAGWAITKSIENFAMQYPVDGEHVILYFGDIDHAGISIWHRLNERMRAVPAVSFYEACLVKGRSYGKLNQRKNESHVADFLTFFEEKSAREIGGLLMGGAYYPQEVLGSRELQEIMCRYNLDGIFETGGNL